MKKSTKSKLVINDLADHMADLYWTESFGMESAENYSFSINEDGDIESIQGYQVDTLAFLENQTEIHTEITEDMDDEEVAKELKRVEKLKKEIRIKARAALVACDIRVEDENLVETVASQTLDARKDPSDWTKPMNESEYVYVSIQRKRSTSKLWKDAYKDGVKLTERFPLDMIFNIDEEGNNEGLKTDDYGIPHIEHILASYGFVGYDNGEWSQRFMLRSPSFKEGTMVGTTRLHGVVAPSDWAVSRKKKVVYKKRVYFTKDTEVELSDYVVLQPSDADFSQADLDEQEFNDGILTGRNVATKAMANNDITKAEVKARKQEEKNLEHEAFKAKLSAAYKQESMRENYKEILASKSGQLAKELIAMSNSGDAGVASVMKHLPEIEDKVALKRACTAHLIVNGKKLHKAAYAHLISLIEKEELKSVAQSVDSKVVKAIMQLNKGQLFTDKISDDMVVAMVNAARDNGKHLRIKVDFDKLSARYFQITGKKYSEVKPTHGKVRNVKVG